MGLQGKTIYFPVESLVGLGHFNRAGKIVREMAGAGADVTVASGTFVDEKRFFAGAQCETLPPFVFKGYDGAHYTLGADGRKTMLPEFNMAAHVGQRIEAQVRHIARIKPDVLVSEFWPFDRPQFDDEMQAMIAATSQEALGKKCLRVASVRDMLDRHEDSPLREPFAVQTLNAHYDAVLVHGDPRFVKLDETFDSVSDIKIPVIYTGYVLSEMPARQVPDPAEGPIVVSCGSGVNAHDMVLSFMAAWNNLLARPESDVEADFITGRPLNIVCGPRFANGLYDEVVEWGQELAVRSGTPVTVERYRTDLTDMLAKAAFSVSLAGYNTTLETLALNVPSILIPKYRMAEGRAVTSDEQWSRLQRLNAAGMMAIAAPETVSRSRAFADMLKHEFMAQTQGLRRGAALDFAGAETTVETLKGLIAHPHRNVVPLRQPIPGATQNKFDLIPRQQYAYVK